jgi:hypothetical protein
MQILHDLYIERYFFEKDIPFEVNSLEECAEPSDDICVHFVRFSTLIPDDVLEWIDARSFATQEFGTADARPAAKRVQEWIKAYRREVQRDNE